jgi:hypothetical protein
MAGEGFARRWSLRFLCLRALTILRHHYFTFLTAGVLGAVGVVAATSASFDDKSEPAPAARRTEVQWAPVEKRTFTTRGRSVIYYLVDSEQQASDLYYAMRGDMVNSELSGGRVDFGLVHFLQAGTPMEEANVNRLLHTVVESAGSTGTVVTIIDLRQ